MEDNNRNTLLWFAGGIALGAGVALLLAPEAGEETRRRLVDGAKRGSKAVGDSSADIIARGRELYERGRNIAEEAADLFERRRNIAEKRVNDAI